MRGDEEAWRRLVNRHGPAVWNLVRTRTDSRADAEDVYQATWLLLAENLERLRDPDAVLAWLVTTARRESGRARRSRRHESPVGHFGVDFDRAQSEDPQQALLSKIANSRLGAAFARLQPGCQRLLRVLAVTPEASYAQISDSLGIPHGTIGPKKSRCLTYLRQQLALVEEQTEEVA
ncbi:RNA polymerase sigma factor [Salinifilum aidingensis]